MAKRMSDEEFMGTQEKFFDRLKEDLPRLMIYGILKPLNVSYENGEFIFKYKSPSGIKDFIEYIQFDYYGNLIGTEVIELRDTTIPKIYNKIQSLVFSDLIGIARPII